MIHTNHAGQAPKIDQTAVHNTEDIQKLLPATTELTAFATQVRNVNLFLAEAS